MLHPDLNEICGDATLCFNDTGYQFQGVIHASENAQYAVYGAKSQKNGRRKSQANFDGDRQCGCPIETDVEMYDIRIVDCDVGDEYILRRVHGRNGETVTIRCNSINFDTVQTFRGERALVEFQRAIGHKMEGSGGVVHKGPIKMLVRQIQEDSRPWVL